MIVEVPAVTPITIPEEDPTVAFELLLVQLPVPVASFSVVVKPAQTFIVPVIVAGSGFTVTAAVA